MTQVRAIKGAAAFLGGLGLALLLPAVDLSADVFSHPTNSSPIAISKDDRLVWVVNPRGNFVTILRTDTNNLLDFIDVGKEPRSIAVDPNNTYAYAANAAANTVSVIKINDSAYGTFNIEVEKTLTTGAEPWNIVISPDGKRVFVANSGQDTITVINTANNNIIGNVNLRNSICNDPNRGRHFQPRGLAVNAANTQLYVTRFLSFTKDGGRQGTDIGKEGVVCRLNINTNATTIGGYTPAETIDLAPRATGFLIDSNGNGQADPTFAFPNQLQSIVLRGNRAYLPNIAASPKGPLRFDVNTQAFINIIGGVNTNNQVDLGALNLHLGARNPEPGKKKLFFANPWAIGFTNQSGPGNAYVVSAGSDLLVKLNVDAAGQLSFTGDGNTTRYINLNNDPENPFTQAPFAGKNPQGIAINSAGTRAYVTNFVSGNLSIVDLQTDAVINSILTASPPLPNTLEEKIAVGAEIFFSSRGHFERPTGTTVSTDDRLSADGWQNCASCHFNGWTDGVVWAFGAGPRKSTSMAGSFNPQNRNQQKILNYSAIFDEIEDFEINIRNVSGPGPDSPRTCKNGPPANSTFDRDHGLLIGDNGDPDFAPCIINPFRPKNAGRDQLTIRPYFSDVHVNTLTALKLFVQNGIRVPNGPLNGNEIAGGVPASQIAAGRALFAQQKCTNCHGGGLWSSSAKNFASPPAGNQIACEVNLGAAAPAGSFCKTPAETGNPVSLQYLPRFLKNIGSFNLGVPGKGNPIGDNIAADEKAAPTLVGQTSQPPKDALGRDYNGDGRGAGFSPPSLLGVFATPPYYHNGACETLACVVGDKKHRTANGTLPDKINTAAERAALMRFLESIDAQTVPFQLNQAGDRAEGN